MNNGVGLGYVGQSSALVCRRAQDKKKSDPRKKKKKTMLWKK
jgi:hypothetical protein